MTEKTSTITSMDPNSISDWGVQSPATAPSTQQNPSRLLVLRSNRWRRLSLVLAALAAAGGAIYWAATSWGGGFSNNTLNIPTSEVRMMDLRDTVIEQGKLESQSTVTGVCEITGYENKIIFLVPEGNLVKKGEVVCRFDDSQFVTQISQSESQVNTSKNTVENARQELVVQADANESTLRASKQAVDFAELDYDKYLNGDFVVNKSDIEGAISESVTEFKKARRKMELTRTMVKRGFRDYEQLREAEQVVKSAKLRLTRDRQKLVTLLDFEHVKSLAEFKGKFEEAKHKLEMDKSTTAAKNNKAREQLKNAEQGLEIMEQRLKSLKDNLENHTMHAPQDGTITFPNDWRSNGEKLHEGSTVYPSQPVFVLPDMSRMQVKVGIHESLISKIKVKQRALVRIDAFPSFSLKGVVKSVAPLAGVDRFQGSNNYDVIVTIDEFPEGVKLKPGMTAEVEILVGQYPNVLAIPIQSLASFGRKKFVFVQTDHAEFEPREVKIGNSNISFVEITEGVRADDVVALDAYQRAIIEFGDREPELEDASELLAEDANDSMAAEAAVDSNKTDSEKSAPGTGVVVNNSTPSPSKPDLKPNSEAVSEPLTTDESTPAAEDESKPESTDESKPDESKAGEDSELKIAPEPELAPEDDAKPVQKASSGVVVAPTSFFDEPIRRRAISVHDGILRTVGAWAERRHA